MGFSQEMKDFTAGFKAGNEFFADSAKSKREDRRIDLEERRINVGESQYDRTQKQRIAEEAGFTSYEQMQDYKRKFPEADSGQPGTDGSTEAPDMSSNEIYNGFMDTVKTEVQNPYALAVIASTGQRESAFSPGNTNRVWNDGKNNAGGIMSWNGPRLAALQKANGGKNGTPEQQAQFFLKESPELIQKLNGAKSLEQAQQIMNQAWGFKGYNQPNHPETIARLKASRGFLGKFLNATEPAADTEVAAAPQSVTPVKPETAKPAIPDDRPTQKGDVLNVPPQAEVAKPTAFLGAPKTSGAIPDPQLASQSGFVPEEELDEFGNPIPKPMFAASGGVIPMHFADGGMARSDYPTDQPGVDKYSATRDYTQPLPTPGAGTGFQARRISMPARSIGTPAASGAGYGLGQVTPMQQKLRDMRAARAAAVPAPAPVAAAPVAPPVQQAATPYRRMMNRGPDGKWSMIDVRPKNRNLVAATGGVIPDSFAEGGRVRRDDEDEDRPFPVRERFDQPDLPPEREPDAKGDRVKREPPDPSRFGPDLGIAKPGSPMARRIEKMNAPQASPDTAATRASKAESRDSESKHRPPSPASQGPSSDKGAIPDTVATKTSAGVSEEEKKAAHERLKLRNDDYRSVPAKPQVAPPDVSGPNVGTAINPGSVASTHRPPTGPAPQQGPEYIPPEQAGPNVGTALNPGVIPEPEARPSNVAETPMSPSPTPGISRANLPRQPGQVPVPRPVSAEPATASRTGQSLQDPAELAAPAPGTRANPGVVEARPSNAVQTPMTPPPSEPVIPPPEAPAAPAPDQAPTSAIPTPEEQPVTEPGDPTLPSGPEAPIPGDPSLARLERGTKLKFKPEDVNTVKRACAEALTDAITPKKDGALATPEDEQAANAKRDRAMRNADAPTTEEMKQVYQVVDPDNKLSEEEKLMKSMLDQRDWFLAQGLPEKARASTLQIAQYSRKMSQRYGALANEAIKRGNLDQAAKFMQRAYANIPDGRSLEYTMSKDGQTFDWKVMDATSGDVVDQGTAGADDMREMTGALMDGSGWLTMMSQQGLEYGTGGGKKGGLSATQERQALNERQQGLLDTATDAGKALAANPEDEEAKANFEKAYDAYAATLPATSKSALAMPYLNAGLEPPAGLAPSVGSAGEREEAANKKYYDEQEQLFNNEKDPQKKAAIQKDLLRYSYDHSKEQEVNQDQVAEVVTDITDDDEARQSQLQDLYQGLIEDIVAHNKSMTPAMAKRAIDYISDPAKDGGKIGRDGRMKAGTYSFVFNPDLLPNAMTLRKMKQPAK